MKESTLWLRRLRSKNNFICLFVALWRVRGREPADLCRSRGSQSMAMAFMLHFSAYTPGEL